MADHHRLAPQAPGPERLGRGADPAWREALAARWLDRAMPPEGASLMARPADPFRNPVAYTFRASFRALVEGLLAGAGQEVMRAALDPVVRWRALEHQDAARALGFIAELKAILKQEAGQAAPGAGGWLEELDARLDAMEGLAAVIFGECRRKQAEILAREARRRTFVLERAQSRRRPALSGRTGGSTAPRDGSGMAGVNGAAADGSPPEETLI